jgi:hypothetical protein
MATRSPGAHDAAFLIEIVCCWRTWLVNQHLDRIRNEIRDAVISIRPWATGTECVEYGPV